jgi:hypothetical protein
MSAEDAVFINQVNLRIRTMQLALSEGQNPDSNLELVDDQRIELAKLAKDYSEMRQSMRELPKADDVKDRFASLLSRMDAFERRLSSDILLPHQTSTLDTMVFDWLVKREQGNLVAALAEHYPNQFRFSDNQKKRIDKLKTSAREKIAEAKREFQEKLKKISADANTEMHAILTPHQSRTLVDLSGIPKK